MNDSIVYVVDDDASVRETLADLLSCVGLRTEGFALPQDFMRFPRPNAPSCLVLDVRLPGYSGFEFQRELKEAGIRVPIIFITGHGDIPMSVRAMKAGAIEFLAKPYRDQELLDAVQLGIAHDRERLNQELTTTILRDRFMTLTTRERQVMALLVRGYLTKQIAADIGTTESTVKAHRSQIMQKMQAGSLPALFRMADRLELPAVAA